MTGRTIRRSILVLSVAAAVCVCAVAVSYRPVLGPAAYLLLGASVAVLIGAILSFRQSNRTDDAHDRAAALADAEKRLRADLARRSEWLHRKEAALMQKLATYHEWMEFPTGIDTGTEAHVPEAREPAFLEKDREVLELIRERSDLVFEKLKNRTYQQDGVFRRELLVQDLLDLMTRVARVYHPESENPLLETSVEQLLKSANRVALQLLVLLEQLPLDLKTYNIRKIHDTIQKGIKVYGAYKTMDPYWTYLRPVYYLGRFAMGSNPVTLGVSWALGELAKTGAKKASSHLAGRYALGLMHDLVFVVGCEAAAIFGGDFRHREINWIYGAELTDLIAGGPVSRNLLRDGLAEVGRITLRNEYDRIFLYRCLAAGKSASPERYPALASLSDEECRVLGRRLEDFIRKHSNDLPRLERWKTATESRIGFKLDLEINRAEGEGTARNIDALRSLAGFLVDIKGRHAEDTADLLAGTQIAEALPSTEKSAWKEALLRQPPVMFDFPELEPGDPITETFLSDLTDLCVTVLPYTDSQDDAFDDTARFLRREKWIDRKNRRYTHSLAERLDKDSPEKKMKWRDARRLLGALEAGESPRFVFSGVSPEPALDAKDTDAAPMHLMGTSMRLMLVQGSEGVRSHVLWRGQASGIDSIRLFRQKKRLADDCRIEGGRWLIDPAPASLLVAGSTIRSYERYFQPLLRFASAE